MGARSDGRCLGGGGFPAFSSAEKRFHGYVRGMRLGLSGLHLSKSTPNMRWHSDCESVEPIDLLQNFRRVAGFDRWGRGGLGSVLVERQIFVKELEMGCIDED